MNNWKTAEKYMGLVLLALPDRGIELQMKDLKKKMPPFLGGGGGWEERGQLLWVEIKNI